MARAQRGPSPLKLPPSPKSSLFWSVGRQQGRNGRCRAGGLREGRLEPIKVAEAFEKPYFTTIGMTDESCATVYGYASGEVSKAAQEDSEEIEVVIADRDEVRRILKEERVAIMCAYMLMHFLEDEEVFGFLGEI